MHSFSQCIVNKSCICIDLETWITIVNFEECMSCLQRFKLIYSAKQMLVTAVLMLFSPTFVEKRSGLAGSRNAASLHA